MTHAHGIADSDYSLTHLEGAPEPFAETIRHLIHNNWNRGHTQTILPVILSPMGMASESPRANDISDADWNAHTNGNLIRIHPTNTIREEPGGVNRGSSLLITNLVIEIFGTNETLRQLFMLELNRIIQSIRPNTDRRIIKPGTAREHSAIAAFDRQFVEFLKIPQVESSGIHAMLSGELGVKWIFNTTVPDDL